MSGHSGFWCPPRFTADSRLGARTTDAVNRPSISQIENRTLCPLIPDTYPPGINRTIRTHTRRVSESGIRRAMPKMRRVPTLDNTTCGLRPGEVFGPMARPGILKTLVLGHVAQHVAETEIGQSRPRGRSSRRGQLEDRTEAPDDAGDCEFVGGSR
jgi:hypothetical protein